MERNIYFSTYLLQILLLASATEVDTIVRLKKNLTLDCLYSGNATVLQYFWVKVKGSSEETLCSVHSTFGKHISEKYKDKIAFVNKSLSSLDMSITLIEATEDDIGTYHCYISLFFYGTLKKTIIVQAGNTDNIIPSPHQLFMENENISIHFRYNLNGSVMQVILEKFTTDRRDRIASCTPGHGGPLYGFDYKTNKHRFVDCSKDCKNVTLFILNTSRTDKGHYRGLFRTNKGEEAVVIKLEIYKEIPYLAVLIYGVSGAFTLIIVIILISLCIQMKKRRAMSPNACQNMPPGRNIEAVYEDHVYANVMFKPYHG